MAHRFFLALTALATSLGIQAGFASPVLTGDLTFDTHMYEFQGTVTPYFGAGLSAAVRNESGLDSGASLFSETGIVTGAAFNARSTRDYDVLVPLYSLVSIGITADHRFQGWIAIRAGAAANIVSGWGADFPWSVGLAIGIASRIFGPVMASVELSAMNAYPGGVPTRIVSSRAGIRYAPVGTTP